MLSIGPSADASDIFIGDSKMAAMMRAKDWTRTPLGPVSRWPEALKVALRILLTSRFEMWLGWGPECCFFYNDAYTPTLGLKHPQALGMPTHALWAEIWGDIEPRIKTVYERGEATWDRALLLLLERSGYAEETYHTFSYSPLLGDTGAVEGLFCAVTEETTRVISERRLNSLRALGAGLASTSDTSDVLEAARTCLADNGYDLPFSLVYLFEKGRAARLAFATGFDRDHRLAPAELTGVAADPWPLHGDVSLIDLSHLPDLPTGAWQRPPSQGVVIQLLGQGGNAPLGVVIVGLNPHHRFDADYAGFLDLLVGQIASGLASAQSQEAERRRAGALADAVRFRQEAADKLAQVNRRLASEVEFRTAEREKLAQLFKQAPSFMAMLRGPNHVIEFANPAYMRLIGHRPVQGRTVAEALPDAVAQGYLELLDEVFRSGRAYAAEASEYRVQIEPAGPEARRFVDFVYQPIFAPDGSVSGIFIEGVDVTSRTLADAALRKSEAALRLLNERLEERVEARTRERDRVWSMSRDLFLVLDGGSRIVEANPAWIKDFGPLGADPSTQSFCGFVHADDFADTVRNIAKLAGGEPFVRFESRMRILDGEHRIIGWEAVSIDDRCYLSGRDLTDQRKIEDALRQSQKMEAVGQLTGGLAHDFNNLLTGITGSLDLLHARLAQGRYAGLERYIDAAQGAATRAAALTHRLLAFSRRQTLDPRPTDVGRLIVGLGDLIRRTVGPAIEVSFTAPSDLWLTLVDANQLENALLNLCINARDAMPDGGRISVEAANMTLDGPEATARDLPPGEYVGLCVVDTGTGMSPDVIERAFDPFFTTKPLGKGTGLGLSMIYGFARQSGGQVHITSAVGEGTTICLFLPRYAGSVPAAETGGQPLVATARIRHETVLVVDDEPTVRLLVVEVLEELGFTVMEASDAASGLQALRSRARIDLLITDVGLPGGMNGRQLADAARDLRPSLQVLFITGYAETAVLDGSELDSGMRVLTKPFAMEALGSAVETMLLAQA